MTAMAPMKALASALLLAAPLPLATAVAQQPALSAGTWRNPANSVHIEARPCGDDMCGVVVWANDKAVADARKGSPDPLVGAQLFRDFVEEEPGIWRGRVFVPDIGQSFTGRVTVLDHNRLEARGCLVGRVGCRSQIWSRVEE